MPSSSRICGRQPMAVMREMSRSLRGVPSGCVGSKTILPWKPVMRAINHAVGGFLGRATAAQNLPSDRVGAINRAYTGIHHLKQIAKRAKQANRTLYKLVQAVLILGVLYLLIF